MPSDKTPEQLLFNLYILTQSSVTKPLFNRLPNREMEKISFRNDILPLKNKLFRLAFRITLNNAEAEDIVQETLIKVWKKRESWNEIESIEAFCYSICRNLALDRTRRADKFNESLDETQNTAVDTSYSANPEERVQQGDRMRLVKELIDHLPEKQRSVIQLRDFEGKSYKEIADIMQMTDEQVKVTLFRARQTIKKKFLETEDYGL